jgi:glucokinase
MLLAGDIGGTKTRLGVFSPDSGARLPLAEDTFPSADFPSLEAVITKFLSAASLEVKQASFGVAGPVIKSHAKITNLNWEINAPDLQTRFNLSKVHLLNDMVSMAAAVPWLDEGDLHTLVPGIPETGGTIALIAPGTGLGESYLTWDGNRYHPYGSEGGHSDFAPSNKLEIKLLQFLRKKYKHVSCERVCSGSGIPNIYAFFKHSKSIEEPGWLAERLAVTEDATPVIARAAVDETKPCEICRMTMNTFISILGAEAGNLALKVLSTGGVYLGGGIPPRILPALGGERFRKAFLGKGRMKRILKQIPVKVITNRKVALIGAACFGLEHWET